ncbi:MULTISPECIES: DNA polymerase III subunit gamma/tau [Aneurinibacillus]|uniref:DNA-directed DNA polymerase n=1 Tax=Aneurinibacillus thermoaerophilus TaxID=143495 RepID=A0A1G8BD15_ANETH|nr:MULTISPECIES: DNA polymerase III subunit gamma/tau [Aneurinibacillus]AMA71395.1 DNA polymerase III subunit gamma/tau [Aneurinibacillus sp. XH2]MED0676305.1 DNA polymerase III subunit gamma/tau [Aneurinibacillus thermoaerophilus]MED0678696.1 DNA polymerase III subunit gamma/tau [Aneurinibacillus thermoaerophilus]MED0736614.1 DNA polymerase III subunit gamma/tau [Aneurinibacillus thermoaerophilus]MED0755792.1 DNA polymerase III subunit gamma/tau [Aneurinibacillus thermoaerophilus]
MAYQALYRIWRPQTFADIVGQEHVTRTLQNALKEQRFSHAYLFNGPRGTGKTSAAKVMAKAVNCEKGPAPEPCNECAACRGITEGSVVDVMEIDAASNRRIEEIRDIRDKVKYAPTQVRYKVYIVDEVHMLTPEAFNALLKTLEEPPAHVIFILATTDPHKLPATIISRCQRFDFRRISSALIVKRMKQAISGENVQVSDQALTFIARMAEGGMRDALSLLDQTLSFGGERIELEDVMAITGAAPHTMLAEAAKSIEEGSASDVLDIVQRLVQNGKSPDQFLDDLLFYFRDLLLYKTAPQLEEIQDRMILDPEFKGLGDTFDRSRLFFIIERLNQAKHDMKRASQPRIMLELILIQLCQSKGESQVSAAETEGLSEDVEQLKRRIHMLEKQVKQLEQGGATGQASFLASTSRRETRRSSMQPTVKIPTARIREVAANSIEPQLKRLCAIWPDILQQVKARSFRLHAWLLDGRPVALSQTGLVVCFKSVIHCETTARELNKQLIEEVVKGFINRPIELFTLMENQWKEISESLAVSTEGGAKQDTEAESQPDPIVEEAVRLFGEDLVDIKD